ncbi:hypothetical protein CFIO01_02715 [Colletotrichum fioriniae PJ7]|uniref:Uncharacterized protein n=1 Tax=Colletotrichum fioriniae PJ7 TaxID=1445577 RepID=A0A010R6V5_9PEZI|nr:hypothetical protein CFIO01_02715 [Colletotrichum fioriniae PJ7]
MPDHYVKASHGDATNMGTRSEAVHTSKRSHASEYLQSEQGDSNARPAKRARNAEKSENLETHERTIALEEYTVGWVCALPLEMAAARLMLDQVHPDLSHQNPADHNNYILGQVQNHNVVIACLPAGIYGLTPAATVAKDMLRTFKSIRFGLMVGIGGGAPSRADDIRLGDIVVGQPTGTIGGIIQYDRGKVVQDGVFQRTGTLNTPPPFLLTALSRLKTDHFSQDSRIPRFVSELVDKAPKKMKKRFSYQGTANDCLYEADYEHVEEDSGCDQCDRSHAIQRDARDDTDPVIHYGNIASGNQVIKHGKTRDRMAKDLAVLCFEMEAAGLQDFPCLVIRGICDYSDSHKNKMWQEYASATAAAFAKEFLSIIPPDRVMREKTVPQLVSANGVYPDLQLRELVHTTNNAILEQTQKQDVRSTNQRHLECHRAFKTSTYEMFKNINPIRSPGTCNWVLQHDRYKSWKQSTHDDLLWISADPGCGKSVLSRFLVEEEFYSTNEHTVCHFFFKDNEDQNSLSIALCALNHQLYSSRPFLIHYAIDDFNHDGEKLQKETDKLWRIFTAAAADCGAGSVTCIIDALDECCVEDRRKFINFLTKFHSEKANCTRNFRLKFLVTSRPYQDIELEFSEIPEPHSIRLVGEDSNADISQEINLVIRDRVEQVGHKLNMNSEVQRVLQEKLLAVPHRTYLWLHLVMDEVVHSLKRTMKAFLQKITLLPTTIEDAYEKILGRLKKSQRRDAEILLHLVVSAQRPLTLSEMDVAFQLATDAPNAQEHGDLQLDEDRMKSEIRQICGLFVFISDRRIHLIHQTAKDFLIAKEGVSPSISKWKSSLCKQRSDSIMAQACIRYLFFRDLYQSHVILRGHVRHVFLREETLEFGVKENPFLFYAAKYWPVHSRDADPRDETIQNLMFELYDADDSKAIFWWSIRAYGYSNRWDFDDLVQKVHVAALNAHPLVLSKLLLRDMVSLEAKDGNGSTPLLIACESGHSEIVRMLLDKGANIDASGIKRATALIAASLNGSAEIVQMLLDKGADVNFLNDDEYGTALIAASYRGFIGIVQMLLDKGAEVDAVGGDKHSTALIAASLNGSAEIVQMLLDRGADVNAQGCCSIGKLTQMLLSISPLDSLFGNALQAASRKGHGKIMQMLLDKGADSSM